jgi:hypothetical protein
MRSAVRTVDPVINATVYKNIVNKKSTNVTDSVPACARAVPVHVLAQVQAYNVVKDVATFQVLGELPHLPRSMEAFTRLRVCPKNCAGGGCVTGVLGNPEV